MSFEIEFTPTAAKHIRDFRRFEQKIILEAINSELTNQPIEETRNRKSLRDNELSDWELRVDKYRVFYDVLLEGDKKVVKIKGVGYKEHNTLYIGDKEVIL